MLSCKLSLGEKIDEDKRFSKVSCLQFKYPQQFVNINKQERQSFNKVLFLIKRLKIH